jgi:CRISPR-associated endoribonuclease Cas6
MLCYNLKVFFGKNGNDPIPFDYHDVLRSFFYDNIVKDLKVHDQTSLFSISPLLNESSSNNGCLRFDRGAIFYVSTPSRELFDHFSSNAKGLFKVELGWGLYVKNIEKFVLNYSGVREMRVNTSPIYLGPDKEGKHITFENPELAHEVMKRVFISKAKEFGVEVDSGDIDIRFVPDEMSKTKRSLINGHSNITSKCKLRIKGEPYALALLKGFGVGLSTGCTFGFVNIEKRLIKRNR